MRRVILMLTVGLLSGLVCSSASAAGPKKIGKCKTITASGSYAVSKNLQASTKTNGNCIIIDADFVTLDLNGYTVTGDRTGTGVWDNDTARQGIVVRNGMITEFAYGIELSDAANCTIDTITAIDISGRAIEVGDRSIVTENVVAESNYGIRTGEGCIVRGNTAVDSDNYAIVAGERSTVSGNAASADFGGGMHFSCPCNIVGNTADGWVTSGSGCQFIDNLFY